MKKRWRIVIALFDSGSSQLHFSWWDGKKIKEPDCISYPESSDELTNVISGFLCQESPQKVAACSVSPFWKERLFDIIDKIVPGKLVVARTVYDTGLPVIYEKPETLGVDRVLGANAAYRYFHDSCVVVDAGTAITVDAVASDGTFLGGYIFPGLDVLSWSIAEKTALPHIAVTGTCEGIGNSTETCISYGIPIGYSGAVVELIRHAASRVDGTMRIIVTGGNAEMLISCLPLKVEHRPYLVLEGLGYITDILPVFH